MTTDKVIVVGAGVSGLTTGVVLLEAGLSVVVVAEEVPGRTSLAAGALWGPYLVEPWPKVREWSLASLAEFRLLAEDGESGVRMTGGIEAARHSMEAPEWSELLPDFRPCDADELPPGFVVGHRFTVPLVDMPVYLAWLRARFLELGGQIETRTVRSFDEFRGVAAVVNCSGLGARALAIDTGLRPIRGQHVIVENPGLTEFFSEDTGLSPDLVCFYPHGDTVTLGGTAIDGDGSLADDDEAVRNILKRCAAVEPRLASARIIEQRIGARPTRAEVRVELDTGTYAAPLVHNYGHGGAGVTLSWGCARETARLVTSAIWTAEGH
ncbi:FAD-dependent oxidoreductase [Streptomyces katsurahamanus]|uniref:D-amino-acid oxidase n=1 Tax=Streptomyces katsurahamanus TaxID=2577098 RepID=A0ABW9NN88_9ACTN|nr:FAD-dependent oxidoreductase [Streptomyces katsurahamanus]MQS34767.1 FAD-dependent oxidoreductase [Streptomyces katsurahamanus]